MAGDKSESAESQGEAMSPAQPSSTPDSDGKLCLEKGVNEISQYSQKRHTNAYSLLKTTLCTWFAIMRPNFKLMFIRFLDKFLCLKVLVATFNKEKALVGAFSC